MPAFNRWVPLAALLLAHWASVCLPVCVEVPSETEAVQGSPMKLRCISCMKREEVEATTVVEWFYRPEGGKDFLKNKEPLISAAPGQLWLVGHTHPDSGFLLAAGEDFTSVVSEIMMYILLVFLTLWLLIEMVYCYRKVSKAEEAAQESASDYLAIPSENKENSAVPVEE
ncbi:sodium channel subunit beta-3 [Tupaia chinensis]|uniref:sodium channel subunit beta-3 n=1 Tax=Tupaia chinensis TaxID=246437 RepID=UPI000FFB292F|nr:sodium channel subunit beta-3 [Tupaia chinensis]